MNLPSFIQQASWYPWLAMPCVFAVMWLKYRHKSFRLSQGRVKHLKALVSKRNVESIHPLAFQLAVHEALGQILDDRWIAMALCRHRPWNLLIDCKNALGLIKLDEEGCRFLDVKPGRRFSHRTWAVVFFAGACLPLLAIWVVGAFKISLSLQAGVGLLLVTLMLSPFLMWISNSLETAHRLVHKLDDLHPWCKPLRFSKAGAIAEMAIR